MDLIRIFDRMIEQFLSINITTRHRKDVILLEFRTNIICKEKKIFQRINKSWQPTRPNNAPTPTLNNLSKLRKDTTRSKRLKILFHIKIYMKICKYKWEKTKYLTLPPPWENHALPSTKNQSIHISSAKKKLQDSPSSL